MSKICDGHLYLYAFDVEPKSLEMYGVTVYQTIQKNKKEVCKYIDEGKLVGYCLSGRYCFMNLNVDTDSTSNTKFCASLVHNSSKMHSYVCNAETIKSTSAKPLTKIEIYNKIKECERKIEEQDLARPEDKRLWKNKMNTRPDNEKWWLKI